MPHAKTMDATRICEEILRADRRYNDEHECLSSETAIIDRLLDRRLELVEAYVELHTSLASRQHALEVFFGLLVSTAAFWSPDDVSRARSGRARLIQVNALIARKAEELALLLDERSELHEDSGFSGATHYHVARVIEEAASANHLFRMWVRDQLAGLRGQFSLKYWPTISEFVRVLGRDAARSEPEATDPITEAAAKGVRGSLADFF